MSRQIRPLAPFWAAVASVLVLACGGDNLVLPSEGTAASIAATRGNNQSGTVGAALADSLQVRVLDKEGRPVPDQPVSWAVTTGNGSVAPATNKTDANGYAGARWTLGTGAGAQRVVAKPTGNGAPDNLQAVFSATASASAASKFTKVSGDNQTAVAGSALPDSLIVRVSDSDNNPVAGVEVSWTVAGNGAVSSPTTTTGADGRTGVKWTLGAAAGSQSVSATAAPLPGAPVSFSATATVGSAGRLTIVRAPSAAAASGVPFAQQPQVQLQDAGGNPVSTPGIAVQAAIASHPGSGTLTGNLTAITAGNGLATFSDLGIAGPPGDYTLNFSVPNRDDISGTPPSSTITLSAGVASRLTFHVQPTDIAAGGTIAPAVTVRVEDAQGNLVTSATTSVTMALSANPGTSTLSGTTTVAAVGGIATFADLSLNRPGNGYTLRATASGLTSVTSGSFDVTTGGATTIAANSSTTPSGTVGGSAEPLPSVKVTDAQGNGVSGVEVTFAVTQGGGTVSDASPATNAQGIATVGNWTLGPTAGTGNNKLTATVTGLSGSPVEFTATATPGSAGKLGFITQPAASGTSGQALNPQPVLQLYDNDDNPVSQGGIEVTATLSAGPGGTLTNSTKVTTTNGRATFSGLRISGPAGTYKLAFSAPDVAGVTSNDIVIAAGAATKLGMVTQPATPVQNGQVFPTQPVVQLQDADGNPVSQSGVTVNASLEQGGATLGGDASVQTDSTGRAVFTDLKITGATGTYSLLFGAAGKTTVSSADVVLTAGSVTSANSDVSPASGSFTAGDANGFSFTVTAKDQSDNPVPDAPVVLSGFGDGSVDPSSGQTGPDGTADFVFRSTKADTQQITVTVGGVVLGDSPSVIVTAGSATSMAASAEPEENAVVGSTASPAPSVRVTDAYGNPVSGVSIHFVVSGGGGSLSGNGVVQTGSNGIAAAGTWTLGTSPGTNTLTATSGALTGSPVTFTTEGMAGPAANFVATSDTNLANTLVGTSVSPVPTVKVTDGFGNPVEGVSVHFEVTLGNGAITNHDVDTLADGTATVGDWRLGPEPGANSLTASVPGSELPLVTFLASGVAGSPSKLTFAQPPTDVMAGATIFPAVTVRVEDSAGHLVTSASNAVTIAIDNNPGGATLSGTVTVNAINGIATFADLGLDRATSGYTFRASSPTLTDAVSGSFQVTAGAATQLKFSQQPANTLAGAHISPAVTVQIVDANGNLVSSASTNVTLALQSNPGSATLDGTLTVPSIGGVATFSDLSLDKAGTGYTLAATGGGLTQGISGVFAISPAAADHLVFEQQPSTVTIGQPIAPPVTVRIEDQFGNLVSVPGHAVTLQIGTNPGAATLTGGGPIPASGGMATFDALTLSTVGSGYTLNAQSGSLVVVESNPFDVVSSGP